MTGQWPVLAWEGPDEEGYLMVCVRPLTGFGPYAMCAHGKTVEEALHRLGSVLDDAFEDSCEECRQQPVSFPLKPPKPSTNPNQRVRDFSWRWFARRKASE